MWAPQNEPRGRVVGDESGGKGSGASGLFKIHLRMLRNRNLICLKMGLRLKTFIFMIYFSYFHAFKQVNIVLSETFVMH